jgi:hypothetical protein
MPGASQPLQNRLISMNRLLAGLAAFLICQTALPGELKEMEPVKIKGDLVKSRDISALGIVGDYLVVGSDEADRCQVLKSTRRGYALLPGSDVVLNDRGEEVDIEAIACDGGRVYVIGSHAYVRPALDKEKSYRKNRERIEEIRSCPSRDLLARFTLDENGKASSIEKTSLRSVIEANPILRPFARIPAKENGVNIEGLAVKEGRLHIGFRGPVLHGNYVPVLACDFEHVDLARLLWVNLGGLGVRDLAATKEGFLILAGPMGDGPGSYKVFSWNGYDCLPGVGRPEKAGEIKELCQVPHENGAHPEGIAITQENQSSYEFLIAFDGLRNGGIKRFRLSKP